MKTIAVAEDSGRTYTCFRRQVACFIAEGQVGPKPEAALPPVPRIATTGRSHVGRAPMTSRKAVISFFTGGIGRGAGTRTARIILSIFALAVVLCHLRPALATTYYVSATGNDSNIGTSTTAPFLTIKKAAGLTNPGDIVNVMNGTYGPFTISRSGSQSGGYITYQAYPGQHPTIQKNSSAWNGILIADSTSYIVVQGFTVLGNAQSITVSQAQSAPDNNFTTNGNCIGGHSSVHHVKIFNNTVSYCPGAGITFTGDYVWIYRNVIHHNSFWSPYATSGITVQGANSDASTATKIFVYDNLVYNNQNYICNKYQTNPCEVTDGMGIILDDNITYGYTGRTKIYNNIIYNNGGPAISANHSQHVDIVNNTTYKNNLSATEPAPFTEHPYGGEITLLNSSDARVLNNINYGSSSVQMFFGSLSSVPNLVWDYNILFNGIGAAPRGPHDLAVNPLFVSSPPFNFHLQPGSPAIGSGTSMLAPPYDFNGNLRLTGSVDRGAYRR